ncbi:MAG: class I SAM-dependent methyltransferase [Syntrophobacteraceae bacterium]|jgi:ubiquinone/menaquinone biosynthesis C-methylase UbiE
MSEFDQHASNYSRLVQDSLGIAGQSHDFFLQVKAELLLHLLESQGSPSAARVLDVGCGIGLMHRWFDGHVAEVHGVDMSEESLTEAQKNNPDSRFALTDGKTLPYEDARFDLAFAVCVFHHLTPDQWSPFVAEMKRVVRPNGIVAILEHNPLNPLTQFIVRGSVLDVNANLLTPWKTRGLFGSNDFHEVRTEYFLLMPFRGKVARKIDKYLAKVPLGAQYIAYGKRL